MTDAEQGILSPVVGQPHAKAIVRGALRSGDNHILLVGPPGCGKSAVLMAIEDNVPNAVYRDGKRFHAPQVQKTFASNPNILLIDEFDALTENAYDVLSNPLEHNRLTEDSQEQTYDIEIDTQVIAACNHTTRIPGNIRSRFQNVEFDDYTKEQNIEIARRTMPDQIDWIDNADEAEEAARVIIDQMETHDQRDIRDICKMATDMENVKNLALAMSDPHADIESDPISPEEVANAKEDVGREKLMQMIASEQRGGSPSLNGDDDGEMDPEEIEAEIDEHVKEQMVKQVGAEMENGQAEDVENTQGESD